MAKLELDKAARDHLSRLLAQHLLKTFDLEIDPFDGLDLIAYLAETMGPYFYNQGLLDAQIIVRDRMEQIADAIDDGEMPLPR